MCIRRSNGIAQGLLTICPKTFDRGELLALVLVVCVEHQNNFAGPIARSPQKIILMTGNRRRQSKLCAKKIDRSSLAIVLAEDGGTFLIFGLQVMINVRNRSDYLFPAKLIGENLRQRRGV